MKGLAIIHHLCSIFSEITNGAYCGTPLAKIGCGESLKVPAAVSSGGFCDRYYSIARKKPIVK
jgi:hypothetical protein